MIIDLEKLARIVDETCATPCMECDECPFSDTQCGMAFEEIRKIAEIAKKLTAVKPSSPTMAELIDFWEDK